MIKKTPGPLDRIFQEEYLRLNVKKTSSLQDLSTLDFLTTASPHFQAPVHLAPVLPYFEAIEKKPTFFCFSAPPRHGKALRDDTPMATARGWVRADEIDVGDLVYGSDGKFTTVTGVFPQGEVDLFKVSFSDHSSLITCSEHQWQVRQRYYDKWYTKTTAEIALDLTESDLRKKWRVPVVNPVEGVPGDLPVDPYTLGLWLGDGTTRIGAITSMDAPIRDYLDSAYPITRTERKPDNLAATYYSASLHRVLRRAGLLRNKHVPECFKTSTADVRLAVLQGLADTDGTVAKNGSQQSICTTLPQLRDDIAELVSSLGGTYTIVAKPTYRKTAYNIYFRLPPQFAGFRLARKQSLLTPPSSRNKPRRFIRSVEAVGRASARCFSVAAIDRLYCAGRDYVVTHNSVLTNHFVARHMLRHPGVRVAYGCYSLDLSAGFFSGEVKDICEANGIAVDRKHNTKEEWRLENGSSFKAVAPGSGFTGRGADLIVIDDPYKDRSHAESGKIRETTWNWITDVAFTRRSPNASVVITHCIAGDEPVLMSDGSWKPIQTVCPGEFVRAYENGEFVDRRVLAQRLSGKDPILSVSTQKKSLRVNSRHPFLLASGEWRSAGSLKIGDEVVVVSSGTGAETCDPEWAWFVGFMIGDGWVTSWERNNLLPSGKRSKSRSWCVCAAKSQYPEMNERVQNAFERFLGRRPYETKFGYYRLDSAAGGRLLLEVGVSGGAWGKRVPSWVYRLTPELKKHYIRGYIDADGNYLQRTRESYRVATVSASLAEDTRMLAISAGLYCSKVTQSSQMVQAPHSAAPKLSTIFSVSLNFAQAPSNTETITAITTGPPEDVYDLTVDGAENFVAQGFVVHNTRWHFEDVIGKISRDHNIPYIPMPAIGANGEALWPEQWTAERLLKEVRPFTGEYGWAALYQCNPIPQGGAVFQGTNLYPVDPDRKFKRFVIGIDLAYTKKTHSDYSCAVVLGVDAEDTHYVLKVVRKQCEAPEFGKILRELRQEFGSPPVYWFVGGQEKVIADFLTNTCKVPIKTQPAKEDKFARAQDVAAAWNSGRVLMPSSEEPWAQPFLSELLSFSGMDDPHDDQVDALAAAYIPSSRKKVFRGNLDKPILMGF